MYIYLFMHTVHDIIHYLQYIKNAYLWYMCTILQHSHVHLTLGHFSITTMTN